MSDRRHQQDEGSLSSPRSKYVYRASVLAACLNGVAVGNVAAWPQAAVPQLLFPPAGSRAALSSDKVSWIVSSTYVGMLIGGFTSMIVAGRFGKRRMFMLASVPLLTGWTIVALADNFAHFLSSQIIMGIGGGMLVSQTEMYLSEIAVPGLRGKMSVFYCALIHVGILLGFTIGPLLTLSTATGLYLPVVLVFDALYVFVAPETPFWLVRQGRLDEALDTLRKLRARDGVHEEFENIQKFIGASFGAGNSVGVRASCKRLLGNVANRKAIVLVILLGLVQQFSGMTALLAYAQLIFERSVVALPGRYITLLIGLSEFCCTLVGGFLIERVGRRRLTLTSCVTCAGAMALLGLHFHGLASTGGEGVDDDGRNNNGQNLLPVVCVIVFALAYGLGLSAMVTVVAAECLSMDVRNVGAAIQNTVLCVSAFFVAKLWQVIADTYGLEYSFWTAATLTVLHTIVLLILLPETRGKSLIEIQQMLMGSSSVSFRRQRQRRFDDDATAEEGTTAAASSRLMPMDGGTADE